MVGSKCRNGAGTRWLNIIIISFDYDFKFEFNARHRTAPHHRHSPVHRERLHYLTIYKHLICMCEVLLLLQKTFGYYYSNQLTNFAIVCVGIQCRRRCCECINANVCQKQWNRFTISTECFVSFSSICAMTYGYSMACTCSAHERRSYAYAPKMYYIISLNVAFCSAACHV